MVTGEGKIVNAEDLDVSSVDLSDVDLFKVDEAKEDDEQIVDVLKTPKRAQQQQLEEYAFKVIKKISQLKAVHVDRERFLRTELGKYCSTEQVEKAVKTSPARAGVSEDVVKKIADEAINLETKMVSGLSFLAGLPGIVFMGVTIPLDVANYFAYSLRIEQKLAYIYGWESFLDDKDDFPDETLYQLILFLGVMMGVGEAVLVLHNFARFAVAGVAKTIQGKALTKTTFYPILKQILKVVGVKMTTGQFSKTVAKLVPVAGGVVSAGITFATFKPGANRLAKHLATLPQSKA